MATKRTTTKAPANRQTATNTPGGDDVTKIRRDAATTRLTEADTALKALRAAVRADNADAVRQAAEELAGAASDTRRLWNARKRGAAPRPSAAPGEGEWVAVVDGAIVRDSGFRASIKRDVLLSKKRVADGAARPDRGPNRPSDEVLARADVLTRAEFEAGS